MTPAAAQAVAGGGPHSRVAEAPALPSRLGWKP
jgi:hypothetical protein